MKVQIQTTQNVVIEYDAAGIGERLAATLIDHLILIGYITVVVWTLIQSQVMREMDESTAIIISVLLFLPVLLYHLVCEIFLDGQSFGKKAMQIKVVRLDGAQPSIGGYLLRWSIGLIESFPLSMIGMMFMGIPAIITLLINGKGQRLGDIAANTTVVRLKPSATLEQTIFTRIKEDYAPVFPEAAKLSDRDVGIIKEVLTSRDLVNNPVVVGTLSRKITQVMGIESEMPSLKLLKTVVKDYNYYSGRL